MIKHNGGIKVVHYNLELSKKNQTLQWKDGQVLIKWENTRENPTQFGWFEKVWKEFNQKYLKLSILSRLYRINIINIILTIK